MGAAIETLIADGFLQTVGDPMYMGLMVLGFFGVFVMLQGLNTPAKFAILIPAALLASAFVPLLGIVISFVCGAVLYLAIMRLVSK